MPANLRRYYGSGDLHFVTASCYQRQPRLSAPQSRNLFLKVLELMRRRYRFVVVGYVVMPEHFHLLVSEPRRGTLSTVMQALKLGFVRRLLTPGQAISPMSRKTGETWGTPEGTLQQNLGRIWQTRFYDFNVWTEAKRIEKLRYIHRNPVKRGLVTSPEEWRWSSFRFYMFGEHGPVRINDTGILEMRYQRQPS
ncbi:MAG: transposase [Acidobacteriaceae bacterium]|nr:transposase [Acidobacteriaceae bacterium]